MTPTTHLLYDAFDEKAVFFGCHHKVVRLVLVVDDVLQVDVCLAVQLAEELLVEDECNSADLLDTRLLLAVVVDEVRCHCDRQLATELLPPKSCHRHTENSVETFVKSKTCFCSLGLFTVIRRV